MVQNATIQKSTIESDENVVTKKLEQLSTLHGEKNFFYYGESEQSFSYSEFNKLSNSLGNSLKDLGISKGDRVSVFMKNMFISSISMFGIWKAGGIFVPINYNYIGKSLSYIINDTMPKILIVESSLLDTFRSVKNEINVKDLKVIVYEPTKENHDYSNEQPLINVQSEMNFNVLLNGLSSNVSVELNYNDTANIIYTSGTTGMPKGVVQSHRWIFIYSYFYAKILTPEDVIYNDLPLYHVGGAFFNITRAVFAGCSVALWDKFSTSEFWDRIKKSQSTSAVLVGVMTTWLMNTPKDENDRNNTLNKIHIQPLPSYHKELSNRFGFDFLLAGFGQTESGFNICSLIIETIEGEGTPKEFHRGYTHAEMRDIAAEINLEVLEKDAEIGKGFLGKPASFVEVAILNERDEECLEGEIGELCFRPKYPCLILTEYFNKGKATVEAFSNLWFHTGDSAYKDKEGYYYFVDRNTGILKVRGEKFSSYHVEDLIYEHAEVQMSAVFPVTEEYGDEIALYAVLVEGSSITTNELMKWIKLNLPKYMWPKYVRFIDELPKTLTNKVQKYKLKEILEIELNKEN